MAWVAERVDEFKAKVAQGFAAFRDRSYYLRHVVSWQLLDWTLRLLPSSSSYAPSGYRPHSGTRCWYR